MKSQVSPSSRQPAIAIACLGALALVTVWLLAAPLSAAQPDGAMPRYGSANGYSALPIWRESSVRPCNVEQLLTEESSTNDPLILQLVPIDRLRAGDVALVQEINQSSPIPPQTPSLPPFVPTPNPPFVLSQLAADPEPPTVPPDDTDANPANSATDGSTYGQRPPDTSGERRQFLRTQSPLLGRGKWQFDTGFAYSEFQYNFPTVANGILVRDDLRRRTLISPLALRYGVTPRLQAFANIPVGWRQTENATAPITTPFPSDISSNYVGIGDVVLGGNYLLRRGSDGVPDIVFTLSAGLPTGEKSALTNIFQGGLGTGFPSLAAQCLFIHTYDPVVVFWGGGYNHYFSGKIDNTPIQLGDQIMFQLGTGYSLNDRVTISTAFIGMYIDQVRLDGSNVPDSQQEPIRMRFATTTLRNSRIVEPFAEIGTTSTSPAFRFGVTWTFSNASRR